MTGSIIYDTEKQRFVEEQLTAMLRTATGGYVCECWYERTGARELVHVAARVDANRFMKFSVNVSCDSLWAIAKDVMRAVAERYE